MTTRTEWIGDRFVSRLGTDVLADLAGIGARLGASEGEARGHERVREAFEDLGAREVEAREFDLTRWERGDAGVTVDGDALDAIALPGSPAASVSGRLVHLGYGLPEDFADADLEGAVVVARSDVPEYHVEGCLPPTGSVGGGDDVVGPLPAVGVSKEVGERLRRTAEAGAVAASVDVDVSVGEGRSRNVTGVLGPDTEAEVLVTAHVDGHDISEGALDNASGVATMLEAGAGLAALADDLETTVRLVGFGAEELGLKGSRRYADEADLDRVRAVVNCDGAGRARTLQIRTCGFDALGEAARETADAFDRPVQVRPAIAAHSDHWPFVWRGIPGAQASSDTGSGRGFGHTFADTLDKTDRRAIRTHGILVADVVRRVAEADREVPRRDPAGIRDELVADAEDVSMRVAGEWPFAE
jgi:Zn-dependent M28 family amino/carboxypeptidase